MLAACTQDTLEEWHRCLLTTPCSFILVDTDADISWRAAQIRENSQANATLARTAVQKVFDLAARRAELGIVNARDMYNLFTRKLNLADNSVRTDKRDDMTEGFSMTFVEKSFIIWDRVQSLRRQLCQLSTESSDRISAPTLLPGVRFRFGRALRRVPGRSGTRSAPSKRVEADASMQNAGKLSWIVIMSVWVSRCQNDSPLGSEAPRDPNHRAVGGEPQTPKHVFHRERHAFARHEGAPRLNHPVVIR